jgi:peptide/nickel transport system permease protein
MAGFLGRRLGQLLLTALLASFLVFALNEWSPGSVARKQLGPFATQEQVDLLTLRLGLDRPLLVRYVEWLGDILRGDLGESTRYKVPVAEVLLPRLANTALLALVAFAIIVPASILLGVLAGMREGGVLDRTISLGSIVTTSVPEFASGVFLVSIFVIWLGWLPGVSTLDPSSQWSLAAQLVLPVTVMVLYDLGYVVRMVRASMVEVMQRPYIRTAILKGLSPQAVVLRHALRSALIAPFTVILLQINYLVTGVVVVEAVFAYPGFGRMMLEAALFKDIALIEAGALVAVAIAVGTQIAGDVGYMLLNPRIRIG